MKTLLLILTTILLIGCGDEQIADDREYPTTGHVRSYNVLNEANRVNIFLSLGQSNARGVAVDGDIRVPGVLMPIERVYDYPQKITFKELSSVNINLAFNTQNLSNTALKFAQNYNESIPLYVINIARGGEGIDAPDKYTNHWNPRRIDDDGNSLHIQSIKYLEVLINQLQAEGLEPYVIGFDWNQWESERVDASITEYFQTYFEFFTTFDTVIPNKDYNLFLCRPTSAMFSHRDKVIKAFEILAGQRENVTIYNPASFGIKIFNEDQVHYTEDMYSYFAKYILSKIGGL